MNKYSHLTQNWLPVLSLLALLLGLLLMSNATENSAHFGEMYSWLLLLSALGLLLLSALIGYSLYQLLNRFRRREPGARVVRGWRVPRAAAWSMFLWAPVGSAARVRWSGASGARERPRHDCCGGWSFGLPCLYSDDEEVGFARYQGLGSDVRFPGTWIPAPGCRVLFPGSC